MEVLKPEFHYTMTSQVILLSKQLGCCHWHGQSTALDRPAEPGQIPPRFTTTKCANLRQPSGTRGEGNAKKRPGSHKAHLRAGTKIQLPSQLHFYLKEMGKCSAQNLLLPAPLCLEAEEAFAE